MLAVLVEVLDAVLVEVVEDVPVLVDVELDEDDDEQCPQPTGQFLYTNGTTWQGSLLSISPSSKQ